MGGGASGMAAAIAAAETAGNQVNILLLEKNSKLGKKLLATGNGRCNLDNTAIRPDCFFTAHPQILEQMLTAMDDPLAWFRSHGLICRADETGRIYPYSNQAADVVELLHHWLAAVGVQVRTDCSVAGLSPTGCGYSIALEGGETLMANAVICALGGSAGPQFGTDGAGMALAQTLGCATLPLYPCLTGLRCAKGETAALAGIRAKADAALYDGQRLIHRESGEIQFTDYGLSGIAVMQLSGYLAPSSGIRTPEIRLDLFPHLTTEELAAQLQQHSRALPGADARTFMTGLIHRQLGLAVWKVQQLGSMCRSTASLTGDEWNKLARGFKSWCFTGLEPTGWKNAQTTGGGVALPQLEPETFQLKTHPGLYIVGEMTDCAGSCGGFNLHWAFGSGLTAGRAAAMQCIDSGASLPQSGGPAVSAPPAAASRRKRGVALAELPAQRSKRTSGKKQTKSASAGKVSSKGGKRYSSTGRHDNTPRKRRTK